MNHTWRKISLSTCSNIWLIINCICIILWITLDKIFPCRISYIPGIYIRAYIQGSKPNFKLLSNTIVFYFVHLHNIKETIDTLLVRLQVFYMFLIEVKYRVLKNVNLILIIWRAGEAASDRMYKHRQVCWEIMTRHHCYWHLTAWTKQGIVSHFNIYMIRTWSRSSKYATLMKRSKNS